VSRATYVVPTQEESDSGYVSHQSVGGDLVFADCRTRVAGDELPDYEEREPSDTDMPPEFDPSFNPPEYIGEEPYNVSRASLDLQQKYWKGLDTAIEAYVQARREPDSLSWDSLKRRLRSPPKLSAAATAMVTMRRAMVEADTIIGTKLFQFLVEKHTRDEDIKRAITVAHELVTNNAYATRVMNIQQGR